jgi:hypothetical protein
VLAAGQHESAAFAVGSPMSLIMVLAVSTRAISKELGLPLRFPGTARSCYGRLAQVTEAALARRAASAWAATAAPANQGGALITSPMATCSAGTMIWPAASLKCSTMDVRRPSQIIRPHELMADKAPVWQRVVKRHRD